MSNCITQDPNCQPQNSCSQGALSYASSGWAVLPLCWPDAAGHCACGRKHTGRDIGKAPLTPHGVKDASTDERVVRRYWCTPDANVGIATGAVSGLVVLDVDGPDGVASLAGKTIPPTPCVLTSNGKHFYFRHPGGVIRNFVKKLPGLDLRGDGGYVVAPPSTHLSGKQYMWLPGAEHWTMQLADIPNWLLELIGQGQGLSRSVEDWRTLTDQTIPAGQRNSTIASLAGLLLRRYVDPYVTLNLLVAFNDARCIPPLDHDEVARTVDSVARLEARRRGLIVHE